MATIKSNVKNFTNKVSTEVPQAILKKFETLVRESGSEDERKAADYLVEYLQKWGVSYEVHQPKLYLSIPKEARLKVISPIAKEFTAKTPSFSVITEDGAGEVIYIPTGYATGINDVFGSVVKGEQTDLNNKVVLTEGFPMPGKVQEFIDQEAKAIIFISPGENIHEGISTPIWGAPDLDNINNEPSIPILAISKSDGAQLIEMISKNEVTVEYDTHLEKGWFPCPVIDVFIKGTEEPEKYLLLHGHLDSWHKGIGDNATGNAAMLEMIRIFKENQQLLKRSIRVVIWPGHSTGRYGGSTWFADHFGLDLERNCIAQVNCDSPGCRWATSYEYMMWTSEADEFCKEAIKDAVGQISKGSRPIRAGDYSFNNIGISSFFMLSSSIPEEVLKEKGYYYVGGCGGNIEWHTEEDLMHVADMEILVKDIKVYVTAILRVINATVYPFNFTNTAKEIQQTVLKYQEHASSHFNFDPILKEVKKLEKDLLVFNKEIELLKEKAITDPLVKKANKNLMKLARLLIPINYTRKGKFRHDPAHTIPPLPDIAPVEQFNEIIEGSHEYYVLKTHLTRGQNRIVWTIQEARELIDNKL